MSDFDPMKAQRELVNGLADMHKIVINRARDAEKLMAEAEIEHAVLIKISAFSRTLLEEARAKLKALEDEAH
jgi:hypothetical protein